MSCDNTNLNLLARPVCALEKDHEGDHMSTDGTVWANGSRCYCPHPFVPNGGYATSCTRTRGHVGKHVYGNMSWESAQNSPQSISQVEVGSTTQNSLEANRTSLRSTKD